MATFPPVDEGSKNNTSSISSPPLDRGCKYNRSMDSSTIAEDSGKFLPLNFKHVLNQDVVHQIVHTISHSDGMNATELKRLMIHLLRLNSPSKAARIVNKPSANSPEDMVKACPMIFNHGDEDIVDPVISPSKFLLFHKKFCLCCVKIADADKLNANCYGHIMYMCLKKGWSPRFDKHKLKDTAKRTGTLGNYPGFFLFPDTTAKEVQKMHDNKVIISCASLAIDPASVIINPLSVVIKNSDIRRTLVLVNRRIIDGKSLLEANEELNQAGFAPVKCRVIMDLTRSGVNSAIIDSSPFRFASFNDFLCLISKDIWLAKTDIARFFYNFSLAKNVLRYFGVTIGDITYCSIKCCFGFTLCPYFCSTYAGEIARWCRLMGILVASYMDDYMTVGGSYREAERNLNLIEDTLRAVGLAIAPGKREIAQSLTVLGFQVDSSSMSIRVDEVQARGLWLTLDECLSKIQENLSLIPHSFIHHICGKLNWFCEIVQSGRCYLRAWWLFLKYGVNLHESVKAELIKDTVWWMSLFDSWSNSKDHPIKFHIIRNKDMKELYLFQSDASADHGFGYVYGRLKDSRDGIRFYSQPWDHIYKWFNSSSLGEFQAAIHYLKHHKVRNCTIVWLTDNLGNAWAINKGRSLTNEPNNLIKSLFRLCDSQNIMFLSIWLPREVNTFSDTLSHIAYYRKVQSMSGSVSSLINEGSQLNI